MNLEMANNRISQLPVAMSGIVHTVSVNGSSLSNFNHTIIPFARRRLP
ncbi:hypothetical protein [Paenibacillus sp. NPDC057967]